MGLGGEKKELRIGLYILPIRENREILKIFK